MYVENNNFMRITITPAYQADLSTNHNFFWEYIVSVENKSNNVVQLLGKHLQIISPSGKVDEVVGNDILGEHPVLRPGEVFEYSVLENLKTSSAIVKGKYQILSNGKQFDVEVPTFSLDNPYEVISIN